VPPPSGIGGGRAQGVIVTPSPFAFASRERLVSFAASTRLPAMHFVEDFCDAGDLICYGPSIADSYRRAAGHVDKILKGAKPGDLPVEQPTRFELTINRETARALGLKLPRPVQLRAGRVME
jgi:putative ABC transport system substrate-binding protein